MHNLIFYILHWYISRNAERSWNKWNWFWCLFSFNFPFLCEQWLMYCRRDFLTFQAAKFISSATADSITRSHFDMNSIIIRDKAININVQIVSTLSIHSLFWSLSFVVSLIVELIQKNDNKHRRNFDTSCFELSAFSKKSKCFSLIHNRIWVRISNSK